MSVGASMVAHNAVEFDYCITEAIRSLVPICDQIVVAEAASTDSTAELLGDIAATYCRPNQLRVVKCGWNPVPDWKLIHISEASNFAKSHLTTKYHVALQADEVLHEDDYPEILRVAAGGGKRCAMRLNFWINASMYLPKGMLVSTDVCRLAPISVPYVGDAESLQPDGSVETGIRIFHYGFIRHDSRFYTKSVSMQGESCGTHDPRLERIQAGGLAAIEPSLNPQTLLHYSGTHPAVAQKWLRDRNRI